MNVKRFLLVDKDGFIDSIMFESFDQAEAMKRATKSKRDKIVAVRIIDEGVYNYNERCIKALIAMRAGLLSSKQIEPDLKNELLGLIPLFQQRTFNFL